MVRSACQWVKRANSGALGRLGGQVAMWGGDLEALGRQLMRLAESDADVFDDDLGVLLVVSARRRLLSTVTLEVMGPLVHCFWAGCLVARRNRQRGEVGAAVIKTELHRRARARAMGQGQAGAEHASPALEASIGSTNLGNQTAVNNSADAEEDYSIVRELSKRLPPGPRLYGLTDDCAKIGLTYLRKALMKMVQLVKLERTKGEPVELGGAYMKLAADLDAGRGEVKGSLELAYMGLLQSGDARAAGLVSLETIKMLGGVAAVLHNWAEHNSWDLAKWSMEELSRDLTQVVEAHVRSICPPVEDHSMAPLLESGMETEGAEGATAALVLVPGGTGGLSEGDIEWAREHWRKVVWGMSELPRVDTVLQQALPCHHFYNMAQEQATALAQRFPEPGYEHTLWQRLALLDMREQAGRWLDSTGRDQSMAILLTHVAYRLNRLAQDPRVPLESHFESAMAILTWAKVSGKGGVREEEMAIQWAMRDLEAAAGRVLPGATCRKLAVLGFHRVTSTVEVTKVVESLSQRRKQKLEAQVGGPIGSASDYTAPSCIRVLCHMRTLSFV
jgi:hypothetical protein